MPKPNLKQRLSTALPFAHLLGLSAAAAATDDEDQEDEMKQRADESDEDYAKRMEEEDKKQRDDESDEDYAKRMEGDDKPAGDDEEAEDESDKEKTARTAERARCAAIFASPAAGTRPDMAAHLAFSTDMSSASAIQMLSTFVAGGAAPKQSLSNRMSTVTTPNPGASAGPSQSASAPQSVAARILAAAKKARGEK